MQGIDKTTLFRNLLFLRNKKEEISKNRLRLGVGVLLPECTFVNQLNKELY
jgi:hypothetical protein